MVAAGALPRRRGPRVLPGRSIGLHHGRADRCRSLAAAVVVIATVVWRSRGRDDPRARGRSLARPRAALDGRVPDGRRARASRRSSRACPTTTTTRSPIRWCSRWSGSAPAALWRCRRGRARGPSDRPGRRSPPVVGVGLARRLQPRPPAAGGRSPTAASPPPTRRPRGSWPPRRSDRVTLRSLPDFKSAEAYRLPARPCRGDVHVERGSWTRRVSLDGSLRRHLRRPVREAIGAPCGGPRRGDGGTGAVAGSASPGRSVRGRPGPVDLGLPGRVARAD